MLLSPNRKSTVAAATLPNCIVKVRMNLFLSDCEYLGYVNKLIGTDLVKKILGRESLWCFQTHARQIHSVDSIIK